MSGDSGSHCHSMGSWLALWEREGEAGRDSAPCSLLSRLGVCVRVCVYESVRACVREYTCVRWGQWCGRQGPEGPSIFLREYSQAGMKDSNQSLTSSSWVLPDFCEEPDSSPQRGWVVGTVQEMESETQV